MQHLDEGTIHAWLDGELPPAEREALEAHIASCEQCAAAVAEARGFVAASSRILLTLDAVPGGVLPAASSPATRDAATRARFSVSRAWMAVAAVLVLSTVTVVATRSGGDNPLAKLDEVRAPRSAAPVAAPATEEPSAVVAAAPAENGVGNSKDANKPVAPQPALPVQSQGATNGRLKVAERSDAMGAPKAADKSRSPARPEKKEYRAPAASAQSTALADLAATAAPATSGAAASKPASPLQPPMRAATTNMNAKTQRDSGPVSALAAPRPSRADSVRATRAVALQQIVVTGEGTTSASEKLGAVVGSDEAPQLVSRSSKSEAGDSVVTTVYAVRDGTVTLIDRSSAKDELRRASNASFSDQVMARARESTPVNSITWTDSSGRTRTLRGAMTQAQLERIRTALFGATP
ncbi:MAG: hypothetical protein JWO39_1369 [Gemmatimonadetes bacterium]|nr:hypothetical protein [Gemmatimonadota bacterium]